MNISVLQNNEFPFKYAAVECYIFNVDVDQI